MAFNVTNLSDYTQIATELLREFALYSESMSRFDYMTGVQHKQYLNYMDTNIVAQAGTCNLNDDGEVKLTEKEVQVFPIAFRSSYCIDDLNKKDLNFNTGTLNGVMVSDLATSLVATSADSIKKTTEKLIFAGNTANGDLINGLTTQLTADADVIDITSVGVTVDNIDNILTDMALAITEKMWARQEMIYIHLPLEYFNLYKVNSTNSNMFHNDPKTNTAVLSQGLFGWEGRISIVAEPGLAGTKTIFATIDSNIVIATDSIFEIESAKIYFDENTDLVKYKSSFKLGVSYKYGDEVIMFIGA